MSCFTPASLPHESVSPAPSRCDLLQNYCFAFHNLHIGCPWDAQALLLQYLAIHPHDLQAVRLLSATDPLSGLRWAVRACAQFAI